MIFIYFLAVLSESRIETSLIGSQLFLHNGSILFSSKKSLQMPGNLITIPALTRFRIFSIKNLRVNKNTEHLITNSEFLQNFEININNCHFSKFLKSPISMIFNDECISNEKEACMLNHNTLECNSRLQIVNCTNRKLEISGSSFSDCRSGPNSGGAIFVQNSQEVTIRYSTFQKCSTLQDYFGGAIYLEGITERITIYKVDFIDCYSDGDGGAGIYALNSKYINLDNINFNHCYFSHEYLSYGGGALIHNIPKVRLNKINSTECNGTFGTGVCINLYKDDVSRFVDTTVSGQYLNGYNCNSRQGIYAFHFCYFNTLSYITVEDLVSHQYISFLFFFSSCRGNIAYFNITTNGYTNNAVFIINNLARPIESDIKDFYLKCIIARNVNESSNIFYYPDPAPYGIFISLIDYYAPNFQLTPTSNQEYEIRPTNDNCYTMTDSNLFSPSEYFTGSLEFTQTQNFTSTGDFDRSVAFTKSKEFSESDVFTETAPFTPTFNFTASTVFTKSKTLGPAKPTSRLTPKPTFSEYRSQLPRPQMTFYNMGSAEKDGKGTKTDLGLATIYVIIALLVVLLIVVIVFAVIKSRKPPVIENNRTFDAPDEFYFPDFEN